MSEFKSSKSKTLATASTLQKVTCPTPVRDPQEILSSGWASAAYQKRYTNRLTNGHPDQGYGVTVESSTDSSDTGRTGSVTGQAVLQRMFGYQRHYKLDLKDEEQPDLSHQYLGSPEARAAFFRPRITPTLNTQPVDTRLSEQLAGPLYRGPGGQAEARVSEHELDGEEDGGTDDDEYVDRHGDGFCHHMASDGGSAAAATGGGGSHIDGDMFSSGPTRSVGSYTAGMPPSRMRMGGGLTHGSPAAAATRFVSPSTHRNGLAHAPGVGHQGHHGGSHSQLPSGLVPSKSETCSSSPRALMQALGVGTGGVRRPFPAVGTRASYPLDGAGTARRASVSGGGMGVGGQALSPGSVGPAGVQGGPGGSWQLSVSGERDSGQGREGGTRLPAAAAAATAGGAASVPRSSNRRASVSGGEPTSAPLPSIGAGGSGGAGGGGQSSGPVAAHSYSASAYHAAANTRARTRRLSLMAGSGGSFLPSGLGAAAGSISPSSPAGHPAGVWHPQPPAQRPGPPAPRQSLPGSGASSFTSPSAGAIAAAPTGRVIASPSADASAASASATATSTTNSQPLPSVRLSSNASVSGELPSPQLGLHGTPAVTTVTSTTTVVASPNGPHNPMHASPLRASVTGSPGASVPLPSTTPHLRTSFSGNANGTSSASFTGGSGGILSQLADLHSGGGGGCSAAPAVNPAVPLSGLNNLAGTGLGDAISQLRGIRVTTEKHHQHQLQQPVGAGARQLPSPARDKRPEPGLAGVTPLLLLPVSLPPVESWVAAGRPAEHLDPLHGKRLVDAPLCVMPRPVAEVDLQTRMANHKAAMRDLVRTEGAPMSDTEMEAAKLLSRLEKSGARARNFGGMSDGADEDEEEGLQVEDVR